MSDLLRGKKIIEQRIEYPLPKKTGVRDYVFHFVPRSDGYGAGAHSFFGKFYPHHVSVEVTSLEALITTLHTAVTGGGVQQIREIVMVSHGNAHGLLLKVLKTVTSANQEFKYLTGTSLALLQKDFIDGKLPTFASQRQVVITHLSTASWVTVRACNFGKSREGLYALYSFFGGKPNVYAPMEYQFFGSQPILEGARLPSKLKVHQHMVRQRFLPADVHTPERQDAIVRALIDPGQFTAPFDIASRLLSGGPADEAQRYEDLVSSLNAGRANAFLKTKFTEQALPLSARANLLVKVRDAAWIIKDVLQHNNAPFAVEYQIDEEIVNTGSSPQPTAILRASAKLAEVRSAQEFIPLQLFFYEQENQQWRAKLFTLAFFTEEANADPANQTRFNATIALLNATQLNNGAGLDLRAVFHEEGFDLSPQAAIGPSTTTGTGAAQRVVWPIQDQGTNYLVKLEHPATANGIPSHTVTVYLNPARKERLLREYDLMATLGSDPDSPGTELPAYFDTFTLDELTGVIDHLRTPYKPGNSYYLHHAQQALQRKKEYFSWWQQRHPDMANQVLIQDPYLELSGFEREERRGVAYEFDFSKFWAEVKASSPSATTFQQDLFMEESLATVLGIPPDVMANRAVPPDMETDSPYTDIEELRALERTGVERFFTEDKFTFEPPPPNNGGITCEEFGAVIAKWKELQGRDTAEIEAELGLLKTADGKTYLQWAMQIWDWSFPVRAGLALNNMSLLKDGLLVRVVARIPGVVTLSAGGLVSSSTLLALLRVWPVIGIPLRMWNEFLNEQVKADQMWETIGHVTAMRQWLRRLEMITFEREDDFPEVLPPINVSTTTSVHPYYLARYYEEQVAEYGRYFVFFHAPERMQKGYDEGVRVMDAAAEDIMEKAEESISTVLAEQQLDACKIKVLTDAGLLDVKKLRARAVREIARVLLDKIPRV